MVDEKAAEQPYLLNIGDKAEQVAEAFENRQKTTQETLSELEKACPSAPTAGAWPAPVGTGR
jgi:type I restriction enzyme R subunit